MHTSILSHTGSFRLEALGCHSRLLLQQTTLTGIYRVAIAWRTLDHCQWAKLAAPSWATQPFEHVPNYLLKDFY